MFHDAETHPTEHWTVTDILANSSNIGTIQIAQRLGKTNLLDYIHNYGLGSVTDIHFPGESAGLLPSYWSGTSIADVPIGQGIAVTAVQMLAAYNTIANGGVYVPPRLVDATIDAKGDEHVIPMAAKHRVVSPTVAAEMTTMLEQVVQVGTGKAANLDPYTVAGKTGTGLVPSPTGVTRVATTSPASPASCRRRTRRSPGWSSSTTPPTTGPPPRRPPSPRSPVTPWTPSTSPRCRRSRRPPACLSPPRVGHRRR